MPGRGKPRVGRTNSMPTRATTALAAERICCAVAFKYESRAKVSNAMVDWVAIAGCPPRLAQSSACGRCHRFVRRSNSLRAIRPTSARNALNRYSYQRWYEKLIGKFLGSPVARPSFANSSNTEKLNRQRPGPVAVLFRVWSTALYLLRSLVCLALCSLGIHHGLELRTRRKLRDCTRRDLQRSAG